MSEPREFKFTIRVERSDGFAGFDIVWKGDCLAPGEFHVIEKSAYESLKSELDRERDIWHELHNGLNAINEKYRAALERMVDEYGDLHPDAREALKK